MDLILKDNAIYQYLSSKGANTLLATIDKTYTICTDILSEIPRFFSNYTMHDIQHALRDIDYMTEFVKNDLYNYSDLHLTLIILSGLLHDTGMFISGDEVYELLSRLYDKEDREDPNVFTEIVQDYVRENHGKRVQNILEFTELAGGAPFKSLFVVGKSYNYADILGKICQSHCENIEWITNELPSSNTIAEYSINPQQIAFLLRIGDALDIDDRRAPDYLEKLLRIHGYSATEWAKHCPITNYKKISCDSNIFTITFAGICKNDTIYRKIMDYVAYVNSDLVKINKIIKDFPAPYNKPIIYDEIHTDIITEGFEPTKLSFNINYEKIVTLLMGEKIYGDKKAGLRELLQNSIDAVLSMKERESVSPYSTYTPQIIIELKEDTNEFIVYDNGIGMTDEILTNYFFQIGSSYYTTDAFRKLNPRYNAIGHFGIGFLACFMLSQTVNLETMSKKDSEAFSMEFDSTSPFVTKKKVKVNHFPDGHGTRITLKYNEIINSVFEDEKAVVNYIKDLLIIDGYNLSIITSDNPESIKTSMQDSDDEFISTKDMDICYKLDETMGCMSPRRIAGDAPIFYCFGNSYDDKIKSYPIVKIEELFENVDRLDTTSDELQHANDRISFAFYRLFQKDKNIPTNQLFPSHYNTPTLNKISEIETRLMYDCYDEPNITYWTLTYIPEGQLSDQEESSGTLEKYGKTIFIFGPHTPITSELQNVIVKAVSEPSKFEEIISKKDSLSAFAVGGSPKELKAYVTALHALFFYYSGAGAQTGKVYMHGISVNDAHVAIPDDLIKTGFGKLLINIHSNDFSLDVSRNKLTNPSQKLLESKVVTAVCNDICRKTDATEGDILATQSYFKILGYI